MRSVAARRLALVAAIVVLAPVWCRPVAAAQTRGEARGSAVLAGRRAPAAPSVPAIRRQTPGVSWVQLSRAALGRALLVVAALALLALLRLAPWATPSPLSAAASSLARCRHAISLRAPPLAVGT
ncbi:MAG: hypothetical protein M3203_15650 [Actinomycetota bacterium]|nr:hypothetical protein [Actinomycetota bacterium]